jgi:hypothetical protein
MNWMFSIFEVRLLMCQINIPLSFAQLPIPPIQDVFLQRASYKNSECLTLCVYRMMEDAGWGGDVWGESTRNTHPLK